MKQWFNVDKQGLGRQAEEQGKGRLVGELIQNALDEPGVTQISVTLALVRGQELADLTVEDDAPEGFHDLTHAYTLFAPSAKRGNPEQRGQFNLGEKLVLAVCEQASITTTKGCVTFDPEQGRIEKPDKRERGSVFQGRIILDRQVGHFLARHHRQGDGDLRDARLVQGVLDKLTDQTALALFLSLATQTLLIDREPLVVLHGMSPLSLSCWPFSRRRRR